MNAPTVSPTTVTRVASTVLFLSFVDVFALLPTVAPHATSLGAGPAMLGAVVGAYSLANLPANIVGGVLIDRWGRRRALLLGLGAAVLAVLAYPLAHTPATLLLARLAHGVAGGVLVPAVFALVSDAARMGQAGRTMGRVGALIGAAAVVAPAGAGVLRQVAGTDAVFLVVAGLLACGWLLTLVAVRDVATSGSVSVPAGGHAAAHPPLEGADHPRGGLRGLLDIPAFRRVLTATAAMTAGVGSLAGFLPGSAEAIGASPSMVGGLFTVYALLAAVVMLGPWSARVDQHGADRPLRLGLFALAAALALAGLVMHLLPLILAMGVFGIGYGLIFPAATGATALVAGPGMRGRAFGLFNAAFSLGLALGPPLVGLVAQLAEPVDPLVASAVLCLVGWIWLMRPVST